MLEFRDGNVVTRWESNRSFGSAQRGWRRVLGAARECVLGGLALSFLAVACDDSDDGLGTASLGGGAADGAGGSTVAMAQAGSAALLAGAGGHSGGAGGVLGEVAGGASSGPPGSDAEGTTPSFSSPRLARYHHADMDRALRFELDVVAGLEPYPASLEYLTTLVARVLSKPDPVIFDRDETLPAFGDDHVWTFNELDEYSRQHAADDASGAVSIHVLFVDGRYDADDDSGSVLGLAWGERYIALFQDAIRSGCSGVLGPLQTDTCELAERSVWAHEFGHVIGLVDNGLMEQTPHRDVDHGRHDASEDCLMYWAYESPAVFDVLLSRLETGQSPDIDFCEHCWADLTAARE
jgi:hypothetical protein